MQGSSVAFPLLMFAILLSNQLSVTALSVNVSDRMTTIVCDGNNVDSMQWSIVSSAINVTIEWQTIADSTEEDVVIVEGIVLSSMYRTSSIQPPYSIESVITVSSSFSGRITFTCSGNDVSGSFMSTITISFRGSAPTTSPPPITDPQTTADTSPTSSPPPITDPETASNNPTTSPSPITDPETPAVTTPTASPPPSNDPETTSTNPTTTPSPGPGERDSAPDDSSNGTNPTDISPTNSNSRNVLTRPTIIGIIVAAHVLVVLFVGIIVIVVCAKCKRSKKTTSPEEVHYDYPEVHYDYPYKVPPQARRVTPQLNAQRHNETVIQLSENIAYHVRSGQSIEEEVRYVHVTENIAYSATKIQYDNEEENSS